MQCRNCSGNDFKKTESGNFKCAYCGTLYNEEKTGDSKKTFPKAARIIIYAGAPLLLVTLIIVIFLISGRGGNKTQEPEIKITDNNGTVLKAESDEPQGEILSVNAIPNSIGDIYFLVLFRNSGKIAIRGPQIIIRLYSESNIKIASGSGYAFIDNLNPGEITPVSILVEKAPKYSRYETEFKAEPPIIMPVNGVFEKKFKGEISGVEIKMTGLSNFHDVTGKIKNTGNITGKYVHVAAVLYDTDNHVIGYGDAYINEQTLKPGDYDLFRVMISSITGKPDHYTMFYDALVD